MNPRTEELLALARTRPLTAEERAELDPEGIALLDALPVAPAPTAAEPSAAPAGSAGSVGSAGSAGPAPAPRAGGTRTALVVVGLLVALGLVALAVARCPRAAPKVTVALTAQRPGAEQPRALPTPATLEKGELLQIAVTTTAPAYLTLYEEEGTRLRALWSSPEPVSGTSGVGPEGGEQGLELSPGRVALCLVSRASPVPAAPETTRAALEAACPDCAFSAIEVQQR